MAAASPSTPSVAATSVPSVPSVPVITTMDKDEKLRTGYPIYEPYQTGMLQVSPIHSIYWEQCGNPEGKPVVCLHGGPGAGSGASVRQHFDPKVWRVIQIDQRGAGKSLPYASLEENTTPLLIEDTEKVRKHLGIDRWVVFGGSWGSTLSLAYAEAHPAQVKALVLRGIFMLRRKELVWFYQGDGANFIYPDLWEAYVNHIPVVERGDMMSAYYRRLTSPDPSVQLKAAKIWTEWEFGTSKLHYDPALVASGRDDKFALAFARIECHYFVNGGFWTRDDQLLHNATAIANIPGTIVHGRYDLVCPVVNAWDLHKAWPASQLKVVPDAGHSGRETGTFHELCKAIEGYAHL